MLDPGFKGVLVEVIRVTIDLSSEHDLLYLLYSWKNASTYNFISQIR